MIIDLFSKPPESVIQNSESVIQNCLIMGKDDPQDLSEPPMFTFEAGVIRVYLDGYAIVPMEKYVPLKDHEELTQKYEDLLRETDNCPF